MIAKRQVRGVLPRGNPISPTCVMRQKIELKLLQRVTRSFRCEPSKGRQTNMSISLSHCLALMRRTHLSRQGLPSPDEITDRTGLHLAHDIAAVKLDRHFTDAEVESDLLVDAPVRYFT